MGKPGRSSTSRKLARRGTVVCACGLVVADLSWWARRVIVACSVLLVCGIALSTVNDSAVPERLLATSVLTPPEQDYVNRVNALRTSRGLTVLLVDDNMEDLARAHTHAMVVKQELHHTPDLFAAVSVSWQKLGENVGFGSNVATTWAAFVASPAHLENLVDPAYDRIGVGVEVDPAGLEWTTHRFLQTKSAPPGPLPTTPLPSLPPPSTPLPTVTIARPSTVLSPPPTTRLTTTRPPTTTAAEPATTTSVPVAPASAAPTTAGTAPPASTVGSTPAAVAVPPSVTPETEAYAATSRDDLVRWIRSTIFVVLLLGAAVLIDRYLRKHPNLALPRHRH